MSVAMSVNNGLHHAASLGTIDASVKSTRPTQIERNYDSEDENSGRRKIKHISSTEFYAKPSQYSKFDIREQYCLTDRQLNTIERSRRDRFFGCLSRRATPQSLLGGCVGRRVPSDENLAVYAPFYKYPRYPHPYLQADAAVNRIDLETSYFRRQPASILSTSKMVEGAADSRMGWPNSQQSYYGIRSNNSEDLNYFNKSSSYDTPPIVGVPGPSPRTKHVSFARSHTLTSFDDFNVGFRSSQHIKTASSQERLLGGKKPIAAYNPCYETLPAYVPQMPLIGSNSALHMISQPTALPRGMQQHGHSHQGQHHSHLGHIHHRYLTVCGQEKPVQTQQPIATILASRTLEDEMSTMNAIPLITCTATNAPAPLSPEVIVVEKKFRNAMKTQATQTDVRKHDFEQRLELSPRTIHRVKVVSQGAQTNGIQNGKFLAQSLLEIPTELTIKSIVDVQDHEMVFRTQSEIPRRQPLELNFPYYQPPPPPLEYQNNTTKGQPSLSQKDDIFTYESNSFPRRTCGYRTDTDYHSLPRRDFQNLQDICKHITECSELLGTASIDIISDLLPPPQEYCHDDEDSLEITQTYPKENKDYNRRKSFIATDDSNKSSPFRRDDVRRQSMPVYVQREKLLYINSTSPQTFSRKSFRDNMLNEKEIIIDFKPSKSLHKTHFNVIKHQPKFDEFEKKPTVKLSKDLSTLIVKPLDQGEDPDYPVYENVIDPIDKVSHVHEAESSDQEGREEQIVVKSAPASPHKDEPLICHPSTYPSSDSLANDTTRDHSDGNWNESQVTVLTAEQRSEASFNSHNLLTPSTRRKHLLLQHQQRSSIDTDALDLEEQFNDQSPTYSQASLSLKTKSPVVVPKESNIAFSVPALPKLISPSIEVTTTFEQVTTVHRPTKIAATSPRECRRNMNSSPIQLEQRRSSEISLSYLMTFGDSQKLPSGGNADVSECSTNTNTEDYATCTDTSRRTAGIRPSFATTTTTTSSSSTTQVPVSTQSSQMDRTHAESSFESASSLHSSKCDAITEDLTLELSAEIKTKPESNSNLISFNNENVKVSPSHSVTSTSSGSYNVMGEGRVADFYKQKTQDEMEEVPQRETIQSKMESISDDERSEVRYSSSGYYESPQDDGYSIKWKTKRYRSEEERRRRKNIMKFNIEKENMRALTSPINREYIKGSPEKPKLSILVDATSPVKLKRFRPKIRRQLRRLSRDDISSKPTKSIENLSPTRRQSEALIEAIILHVPSPEKSEETKIQNRVDSLSPHHLKALSETYQLKTKSIESLNRSVSPGSDSVFYSEADANNVEHNSALNSHDSKEVEELSVVCDSVESLPYIDNEPDIVKPPSDFADSPITSKTTQRLYKKMDKRFRSEERYQGDRGRHYKNRKDNIRAKSEERNQEMIKKTSTILRSTGSSPCILPEFNVDVKQQTIYIGHYDCSRYTRLTDSDIWAQLDHQSLEKNRDRRNSTDSERSFYSKYQVTLHRLVQRRCTLEMYRRQKSDIFKLIISNSPPESLRRKLEEVLKLMLLIWARESHVLAKLTQGKYGVDKTVVVKSDSGEFGFRIHGSKPVVVAAIEPETPAECSGLEVGDIIISVNGIQVLDKHHTEVVKIAHDGCEKLELEVARTLGVLMNEQQEPPIQVIYSGYLWRQSGQAKGSPNIKKWVQRWFVLRSDNCLYYYKTEEDTQPVGAMIMVKHQVDICSPKVGRPHAFKVDCGEGIPLYMAADNEELANSWLMVLKKATEQENSWLDKSSRNLYKTPSSISRPDCSGYLMKLGSKWCGWSKRYCVLKDACLYFFQDINAKTALGMICLHGYKVASISTSALGKRNSFEIVPPESKLRHYYFHAESDMEKKRWISALEYSIDRWIKSG